MANKVVTQRKLSHCYNSSCYPIDTSLSDEVDKSKSISELSNEDLKKMIRRLRDEQDAEQLIRSLRRSSGEKDTYENPAKIDTKTPVDQLYHHGILGMKWGRRRFQNADGTRTALGKRRDALKREIEKSDDYKTSRENKRKSPEGLSTEELKKLNERLRLEADYKNLTTEKIEKSETFVKKAIRNAGEQALSEFAKGVFLGSAKLLVKEISPSFAEAAFSLKDKKK